MTSTIQLKPGFLVSLKSSVRGGVTYTREDAVTAASAISGEGRDISAWTTTKIVEDAAEHDLARKTCGKALAGIRKLCIHSDFGLLCPLSLERAGRSHRPGSRHYRGVQRRVDALEDPDLRLEGPSRRPTRKRCAASATR